MIYLKNLRSEKGLTLVELLAVIVILAIIAIIAVVSISQILNNVKADTHLANARNVLEAGKLAHMTAASPTGEFHGAKSYSLKEIADAGYLSSELKSPTFFGSWENPSDMYDMERSLVVVDDREDPTIYKVNLNIGGNNFIFDDPMELANIKRESFTETMKKELNLK